MEQSQHNTHTFSHSHIYTHGAPPSTEPLAFPRLCWHILFSCLLCFKCFVELKSFFILHRYAVRYLHHRGHTGADRIPNVEFWKSLPPLIKVRINGKACREMCYLPSFFLSFLYLPVAILPHSAVFHLLCVCVCVCVLTTFASSCLC